MIEKNRGPKLFSLISHTDREVRKISMRQGEGRRQRRKACRRKKMRARIQWKVKALELTEGGMLCAVCSCGDSGDSQSLFETPCMVACQVPLPVEFSRQEYWSGLPFPPPGDLPNLEIEPMSSECPALAGVFFTTAPPGKPQKEGYFPNNTEKDICK